MWAVNPVLGCLPSPAAGCNAATQFYSPAVGCNAATQFYSPAVGCNAATQFYSPAVGCNAATLFYMSVYLTLQKFQQTAVDCHMSVRLSVLVQNLDSHWMDFHKIWN